MKSVLLLIMVLTVPVPELRSADSSPLELEDLYIWGDDRADIIGLYEAEELTLPYLNKGNFLAPYKVPYPSGVDAKYDFFERSDSWKFTGGYGSNREYYINAGREFFNRDGWSYFCDVTAQNNNFVNENLNRVDWMGDIFGSKKWGKTGLVAGAGGFTGKSAFDRHSFKLYSGVDTQLGGLNLRLSRSKIDGTVGNELITGLDSGFLLSNNQWVFFNGQVYRTETGQKNKWGSDFKTGYINTLFRDYSFRIWAGINNFRDTRLTGGGRISGSFENVSYSFYLKRESSRKDMHTLYKKYPQLLLKDLRGPEIKNALGVDFSGKITSGVTANFNTELKNIDNYLTFYRSKEGYLPVHPVKNRKILRSEVTLNLPYLKLGYVHRDSQKNIPYDYNSFFGEFKKYIYRYNLLGRATLDYTGGHGIWLNPAGTEKEKISSSIDASLELEYGITEDITIRGGAQNMFSEKVILPVSFEDNKAKLYMILTYRM